MAVLASKATAPPEPEIVKVLVVAPSAAALPKLKVPWAKVTVLLAPRVFTPESTKVPAPDLIRLNAPLMMPVKDSALATPTPPIAEVVMVRSAAKVTTPGNVSAPLPRKLTSAPKVMAPAVVPTTAAPEVLLMEPPLRATVPAAAPSASGTFTLTVPALRVNPPVKVLAAERVSAPVPALVSEMAPPPMIPPTCKVPPLMVTVRLALGVTAPTPSDKEFVPVKAKSAFQFWRLFVRRTCETPLVLSSVPPEIVKVPEPKADAALVPPLLRFNVPVALVVTPPPKVLKPPSVTLPAPASVSPNTDVPDDEIVPRTGAEPMTLSSEPEATVQVWAAPRIIGALIVLTADAPEATVMPPEPIVSAPKTPWLTVTAEVPDARKLMPATEKFWSRVLVKLPVAPVALKLMVEAAVGANSASVVPGESEAQLVFVAPVPVPAFQLALPETSPAQYRLVAEPAETTSEIAVELLLRT